MELSKRLHMVASMVEKGSIPADVGCDHGYVAVYLIREGVCPRVFAMDVNVGPLERAREHVEGRKRIRFWLREGAAALW